MMNVYSEQSTDTSGTLVRISKWFVRLTVALAFIGILWSIPAFQSAAHAQGGHHIVQSGETLSSIARRYGVSVSVLANYNGIANANLLRVGQRLRIPAASGGGSSNSNATSSPSYTNQSNASNSSTNSTNSSNNYGYGMESSSTTDGSTVYGSTVASPSRTYPSSGYGLPSSSASAGRPDDVSIPNTNDPTGYENTPPAVAPTPTPTWMPRVQVYTVRPGDSLSSIAAKFGVSVYALKARNGLRGDTIYAGQRLIIP